MANEIKFLIDEDMVKDEERFEDIMNTLKKKPEHKVDRAHILATFIRAVIEARRRELARGQRKNKKVSNKKVIKPALQLKPRWQQGTGTHGVSMVESLPTPRPTQLNPPGPYQKSGVRQPQAPIEKHPKAPPEEKDYSIVLLKTDTETFSTLIHLRKDINLKEMKYVVEEPQVREDLIQKILDLVKRADMKDIANEKYLVKKIKKACRKVKLEYNDAVVPKLKYYIIKYRFGYGKIEPLLHDTNIIKITCDGANKPLVIKHKELGKELTTNITYNNVEEIDKFLETLADKTKTKLTKLNYRVNFDNFKIDALVGRGGVSSKFVIDRI